MDDYEKYLDKQLKNVEFRIEYDELRPEYEIVKAIMNARKKCGLTQKELSERSGITQSDISRLEKGNANPSLRTLQRLAKAMGKNLRIEFVDESEYIANQKP